MKLKFHKKSTLIILLGFLIFGAGYLVRNVVATVATPYSFSESIYWLKKYAFGLDKNRKGIVKSIPDSSILNPGVKPKYTIVFVGDIMPVGNSLIEISEDLKNFLKGGDYFIANFEGVITEERKNSPLLISDRRHDKSMVEILKSIFPPERTFFSVSNNHSADFGKVEFLRSVEILQSAGFNVFGWNEHPFVDINHDIRITGATMWSNRHNDYIVRLKDVENYIQSGKFNIIFPHFGYEFELYPRPAILKETKELIKEFACLVGHHTHCPQPVTAELEEGVNKLVAYSLGDFLVNRKSTKYQYGIAVKAEIGQNTDGELLIGKVDWRLLKCSPFKNNILRIKLSNDNIFQ